VIQRQHNGVHQMSKMFFTAFLSYNFHLTVLIVCMLSNILCTSLAQFKYDGAWPSCKGTSDDLKTTCWQKRLTGPPKEVIKCTHLNHKERRVFFNYHITHHAGTSLFIMADHAHVPWDGTNGIYHPPISASGLACNKTELLEKWMSNVNYSIYPNKKLLPTDLSSWSDRTNKLNSTTSLSLPRQYVAIERPLTSIWDCIPMDDNRVNSMIVMRNPISRLLKLLDFHLSLMNVTSLSILLGRLNPNHLGNYSNKEFKTLNKFSNYALKWLGGVEPIDFSGNAEFRPTPSLYRLALQRLKSFDHIIIMEAFDETTQFLCCEWGWKYCDPIRSQVRGSHTASTHMSYNTLFNNSELFRRIIDHNRFELKLYDRAIELAKYQMKRMNLPTPALNLLTNNTRDALLKDLRDENVEYEHWLNITNNAPRSLNDNRHDHEMYIKIERSERCRKDAGHNHTEYILCISS
jgi:hypothetical protein